MKLCLEKSQMLDILDYLVVQGTHIAKDKRQKLDKKSQKFIFLGYSDNQKEYRLYDL